MENLAGATTVRLRSHCGRYLTASDDEEKVVHKKDKSARAARWSVEPVDDSPGFLRLRSCVGRLLTASDSRFLLGASGFKVLQTLRNANNASVEWKPVHAGDRFRLQSRRGTFLRGNGGSVWPYKGSVTHDVPKLSQTQSWVLWEVEVLDAHPAPPRAALASPSAASGCVGWDSDSPEPSSPNSFLRPEEVGYGTISPTYPAERTRMGRTINYQVVDEKGEIDPPPPEQQQQKQGSFLFEGASVEELRRKMEERTGIRGAVLCIQDSVGLNRFQRIRLPVLPPNRATMTVFLVPPSCTHLLR